MGQRGSQRVRCSVRQVCSVLTAGGLQRVTSAQFTHSGWNAAWEKYAVYSQRVHWSVEQVCSLLTAAGLQRVTSTQFTQSRCTGALSKCSVLTAGGLQRVASTQYALPQ